MAGLTVYVLSTLGRGPETQEPPRSAQTPRKSRKVPKRVPPKPPAPRRDKSTGLVIEGRVVDRDGKPIWRARVRLLLGPYQELRVTSSRRDGTFTFKDVDPNVVYSVAASTPYCAPVRIDNVEVPRRDLEIRLVRGGRLTGTCLSDDVGMPIRSFTVQLEGPIEEAVQVENPDGVFVINGLPEGLYRVTVSAPGYLESEPAQIEVKEGREVRQNFFLVPAGR